MDCTINKMDTHTQNPQTNSREGRIPRSLLHHEDPMCAQLEASELFHLIIYLRDS